MSKKPLIIALEVIPGAGKTTIMQSLRSKYDEIHGVDQILPHDLPDEDITLATVLKSDQLKTKAIMQSSTKIVVLDRYYQSTAAYHWAYDKIYSEQTFPAIETWKNKCLQNGDLIVPDYTFFIDIKPRLSTNRKNRILVTYGSNTWARKDFLASMREYYLDLVHNPAENCTLVDGCATIEQIVAVILSTIKFNTEEKQ